MNDGFKQRLVGAAVLISLGLILWPIIFSDAAQLLVDKRSQIPPRPVFEKYKMKEPVRPSGIKPVPAPQPVSELAVTAEPKSAVEEGQLDKQGLPKAWALQVASFSQADNANALKDKLQKKGYKAYTSSYDSPAGESIRVFIGPKFDRSTLLEMKTTIDKTYKMNSMVVRYVP